MADDDVTRRRLADLEAQVAALRNPPDLGAPRPPMLTHLARELLERQNAAIRARAAAEEERQERRRLAEERMAPAREKRDRALVAKRAELEAAIRERNALDIRIGEIVREQAEISGAYEVAVRKAAA